MGLRLLLALDDSFESMASVALASFLLHNRLEQILVITPEGCSLKRLPDLAAAFDTSLVQRQVRRDSPIKKLASAIQPYFYCVEALDLLDEPGRYLYVDSDTLCVRSLDSLEQLTFGGDSVVGACSHGRPLPDRQLVLGLEGPYHYFNAGVLLFDSERLRAELSAEAVVDFCLSQEALCRFREQCGLNSLLKGRVQYLPLQYNYLSWMRERKSNHPWHNQTINPMASCLNDVRTNLGIVHFSAGALPDRLCADRLEPVDLCWLKLRDHLSSRHDPTSFQWDF